MHRIKLLIILFCLGLMISPLCSQSSKELPINFERHSERVLVVKGGIEYIDQVIAIASERGLVVIDTGKAPTLTEKYRKIIEREFGRDDFLYVINTHYHFDHTDGNQVFDDAKAIISHEKSIELMRRFDEFREDFVTIRRSRLSQLENQRDAAEPGSQQAQYYNDLVASSYVMLDDLENNYNLTEPNLTFRDRMMLDLGDITLRLYYFGEGRHTGDDIIIHCPEEKLLFTGDLFYKGSLQTAYQPDFEVDRWIEVMNEVLKDEDLVEYAYDTHNGRMTGDFLVLWRDFLVDMYEGLKSAKEEGLDFASVEEMMAYDNKFSYLEQSGLDPQQLRRDHTASLRNMWMNVAGYESASQLLDQMISELGISDAIQEFKKRSSELENTHFFDERDFNTLGYRFMNRGLKKEAIGVFKLNVERYPDSWNVYDSLAEGYMNDGQKELAIKFYEKSLQLNPDNENGKHMLEQLRKQK
jgi:glyoxylase-like metal-dependent hydrolase (beta-lactamase superfamily II)